MAVVTLLFGLRAGTFSRVEFERLLRNRRRITILANDVRAVLEGKESEKCPIVSHVFKTTRAIRSIVGIDAVESREYEESGRGHVRRRVSTLQRHSSPSRERLARPGV